MRPLFPGRLSCTDSVHTCICRRYGIMGIGAVCHTLNPRLSDSDIAYIADHGQVGGSSSAGLCQRMVWRAFRLLAFERACFDAPGCHAHLAA